MTQDVLRHVQFYQVSFPNHRLTNADFFSLPQPPDASHPARLLHSR